MPIQFKHADLGIQRAYPPVQGHSSFCSLFQFDQDRKNNRPPSSLMHIKNSVFINRNKKEIT